MEVKDNIMIVESIIKNAMLEGRCVNDTEASQIEKNLIKILQECTALEEESTLAEKNIKKYETLVSKLNEMMISISECPWVLDIALEGISDLIAKLNQRIDF